ncbi:MAG: peptidylprolyl isomerase [Gammaproteobacteria bacterium SHHR-1]|uniref:FKBP-type peptidyl-prolyl cis-trans isomerase n=1 Tax=Magnetovirga frankeli TaxID=947516 RepID=UPI001293A0CD|nr:peptidylprolyl isomerase [gamma proteobacterium SS-5]
MNQAKQGDTVKIHYTGTLDDGTTFDSSEGREPLEFTLGSGQVIAGFDSAVEGMCLGESKQVSIPPAQAYGERSEEMMQEVPREALPDDIEPTEGMPLQAQTPDGQLINLRVAEVNEETLVLDGNHPLAGQNLNFAIELVALA